MAKVQSVVLVHGAFADGSSWAKVIPLLRRKGLNPIAVQNPLSSLADDVAATKRVFDYLGGPLLLVGHSWGGATSDFAQDLPKDEAALLWATQGPLAGRCFDEKNSVAAWRSKPSWYIVAENDRTIPPAVERDSALRMKAVTLNLNASHVSMLSQPDRVAEFIVQAAEGKR
jgi:pimeloyl-ACP methyl ester carboxylesterase